MVEIKGLPIGTGQGRGPAVHVESREDFEKVKEGDVVISTYAKPFIVELFSKRIAGVVTDNGGRTCHLANVAREQFVPAVLGTMAHGKSAVDEIKEGTSVLVNSNDGTVTF